MNRSLLVLSLSALPLLPQPALAQSSVTIYGILDAGLLANNSGKGTVKRVDTSQLAGNRLGFRGSEDLGDGLSANFNLQMGFSPDTGALGQGGRAFGREASVGLASKTYGSINFGRIPESYYLAVFVVDAFRAGQAGGFLGVTRSTATATSQLLPLYVSARMDNSISYSSPTLGGFRGQLQVSAGEGSASVGRGYGGSLRYAGGSWDVVASFAQQDGANGRGKDLGYTAGGSYDFGPAMVLLGYTAEKNSCATCGTRAEGVTATGASEFRYLNAGVRVPFGLFTAIAQVTRLQDRSDYAVATGNRDATMIGVGYEYLMSKRTVLYGSMGTVDNRNGSNYAIGAGAAQLPANSVGPNNPRSKTVSAGVLHYF